MQAHGRLTPVGSPQAWSPTRHGDDVLCGVFLLPRKSEGGDCEFYRKLLRHLARWWRRLGRTHSPRSTGCDRCGNRNVSAARQEKEIGKAITTRTIRVRKMS